MVCCALQTVEKLPGGLASLDASYSVILDSMQRLQPAAPP